jgi:hypothetical protein
VSGLGYVPAMNCSCSMYSRPCLPPLKGFCLACDDLEQGYLPTRYYAPSPLSPLICLVEFLEGANSMP